MSFTLKQGVVADWNNFASYIILETVNNFLQAITFTLFLHAFAGWFYIAENAAFHPETLSRPLTHLLSWPREDTFGIISFVVSFIALFAFMMIRDNKSSVGR